MAGRPGVLPWNFATFSGNEPVTTLSDNFSFLNNQINDSGIGFVSYAVDTGSVNALAVTLTSPPLAYEPGMVVAISPANTNTGASTINVNALGNKSIVDAGGNAIKAGALWANRVAVLVYTGANFQILSNGSQPMSFSATNPGLSFNPNCAGAESVNIYVSQSTGTSLSIGITNLALGVPVTITIVNTSAGSTMVYNITMQDPTGAAYANVDVIFATSTNGAGFVDLAVSGGTLGANRAITFCGVAGTNAAGAGVFIASA